MIAAITDFIATHGYWAIALLMFVENIFPPLPSELIMPFAGFAAARGDLHPALVVLAGACGSLLGALPWFYAARHWGAEGLKTLADRHGRWLTVSRADLDRAERWFHGRRALVLVLGRLVPGVRTLIAVPAGLSGMALLPFLAWSTIGAVLWSALLTGAGYLMEGRYAQIAAWLEPVGRTIFAALALAYLWRVIRAPDR